MRSRAFLPKSRKLRVTTLILVTIFLFFLTSTSAKAWLWDKKIKEISDEEVREIKAELNISEDSCFHSYSDSNLKKALDKEMDSQKAPGLTYGIYILNAINEEELVDLCSKSYFDDKEATHFFSILADNLASWQKNFAEKTTKLAIKATIEACKMHGLGIGTSALFLVVDLVQINISIKKLEEVIRNRALWHYIASRKMKDSHEGAWGTAPVPVKYRNKQTEEYFKSLWDKYGEYISEDGLNEDFKQQQHEILKTSLLYALGAQAHPIITSPLKITPSPPYSVGDEINAQFIITNEGPVPVTFNILTVGGRDPDDQVADFTHRRDITLEPSESYKYKGTLTLAKAGKYHFFCAYQTSDDKWNTSIDLGARLTDEDRIEDITVEAEVEALELKEQLVYSLNVFNGRSYTGSFVPRTEDTIYLIANKDNAISARITLVYFWPITGKYMASFKTLNEEVEGTLEILKGEKVIETLEKEDNSLYYPEGYYGESSLFYKGEKAHIYYEKFMKAIEEYYKQIAEHQQAQTEYQKNFEEKMPREPKPPTPPQFYVTPPAKDYIINLPVGHYKIRLRAEDGTIIQDSEKNLVLFTSRRTGGTGYEIIPGNKWTKRVSCDDPSWIIYVAEGNTLYFSPFIQDEYNELYYNKLVDPQNGGREEKWRWVHTKPIKDVTLLFKKGEKILQRIERVPYYVKQIPGPELGYEIVEFNPEEMPGRQPTFEGYKLELSPGLQKTNYEINLEKKEGEFFPGGKREIRLVRKLTDEDRVEDIIVKVKEHIKEKNKPILKKEVGCVVDGDLVGDITWTTADSPYIVSRNVVVPEGIILSIQSGVVVKFGKGASLQVDGTLIACGKKENPIIFTSNQIKKAPGDWGSIYFTESSTPAFYDEGREYERGSIIQYAIIEYAGGAKTFYNGAICIERSAPLIDHNTITNNASCGIEAVYDGYGEVLITNNNISDNSATKEGGGINAYVDNGWITITGNTITGNSATKEGGGIYAYAAYDTVNISGNTISGNFSDTSGGGIYVDVTYGRAQIRRNTISNNSSKKSGGGIYAETYEGVVKISENTISGNNSRYGGGICCDVYYRSREGVIITGNTINNNQAGENSGGVHISAKSISPSINNNNIYSNTPYDLCNATGTNVDAKNNYWGTADSMLILAHIYDLNDDPRRGAVNYTPFLTSSVKSLP